MATSQSDSPGFRQEQTTNTETVLAENDEIYQCLKRAIEESITFQTESETRVAMYLKCIIDHVEEIQHFTSARVWQGLWKLNDEHPTEQIIEDLNKKLAREHRLETQAKADQQKFENKIREVEILVENKLWDDMAKQRVLAEIKDQLSSSMEQAEDSDVAMEEHRLYEISTSVLDGAKNVEANKNIDKGKKAVRFDGTSDVEMSYSNDFRSEEESEDGSEESRDEGEGQDEGGEGLDDDQDGESGISQSEASEAGGYSEDDNFNNEDSDDEESGFNPNRLYYSTRNEQNFGTNDVIIITPPSSEFGDGPY